MKKQKRERAASESTPERVESPKKEFAWWPWALALFGLFLAFEAYGPSLYGAFVLDDLALPFMNPRIIGSGFDTWIRGLRPLLMASYWVNYQQSGTDPYIYHATNVFLHFAGAVVTSLATSKLLERAGVAGLMRTVLSVFAGGLFLLHPLQTESVAYVASRSEVLSVLLYYSAFALFLYRKGESFDWLRAVAVVVLFGAAVSTKEHTLTLPVLLVLADFFWDLGGLRKNGVLYGLMAAAMAGGALVVLRVIRSADTVGFGLKDLSPASYLFTQGRVIWMYIRLFFIPLGQNADPDIAISQGPLDHGAIFGLMALAGVAVAAWIYRTKFPLAAFGFLMFLLLLAPTSSIVPIRDVLAERRLYLPFLGLTLVLLEFLRRLPVTQVIWSGIAILCLCLVLTYQRSGVWSSPVALWQDTVAKSPDKWRPQFQLAHAYYSEGRCPQAAEQYGKAARIKSDEALLVDWGLALDCAGRPDEALEKLTRAAALTPTAHIYSQIGMVYGKQRKMPEALEALEKAEKLNPTFEMTYVYRGNVYEITGDRVAAAREYQHALQLNPNNQPAREALGRVSR